MRDKPGSSSPRFINGEQTVMSFARRYSSKMFGRRRYSARTARRTGSTRCDLRLFLTRPKTGTIPPSSFTVTNALDDGSVGSLRYEIAQANATSGTTRSTSTSWCSDPRRPSRATGGPLELEQYERSADHQRAERQLVTIDGGGTSGVFQIDTGVTATLDQLTISDGLAANGGGIDNSQAT